MDNDKEIHDLLYRLRESQIRTVYAIRRLSWIAIAILIDIVLLLTFFWAGDPLNRTSEKVILCFLLINFLFMFWLIGVFPKRLTAIFRGDLPPRGWRYF